MFDLLRRHCFAVAIAVLAWQGWSRAQDSGSAAADEPAEPLPPPARIDGESVPQRAASAPAAGTLDPFFLQQLLALRAEEEAARNAPIETAAAQDAGGVDLDAGPGVPVLRVLLQSTMPGSRASAWINGSQVMVGEPVPGADAEQPPVLLEVGGTAVILAWRGKRWRIDLDGGAPQETGEDIR